MNKNYNYLLYAAKDSKGCAYHWLRYLNKLINDKVGNKLSEGDVKALLDSGKLSTFQRLSLKQAVIDGTPTNERVKSITRKYVRSETVANIVKRLERSKYETIHICK